MRYQESHRRKEEGIVPGRKKDGVKNRKDDIEIRRATIEDNMRQAYVHESKEMIQFIGLLGEVTPKDDSDANAQGSIAL